MLMNVLPTYPLLVIDSKGWIGLFADSRKLRFSWYSALNTKRWAGYDSLGKLWRVSPDSFPYIDSWWRRLLANTIYNPRFGAELCWESTGSYSFSDLQALICSLVDKDDDILTQFVERDVLKTAINGCKTFEELIRKLKRKKIVR